MVSALGASTHLFSQFPSISHRSVMACSQLFLVLSALGLWVLLLTIHSFWLGIILLTSPFPSLTTFPSDEFTLYRLTLKSPVG